MRPAVTAIETGRMAAYGTEVPGGVSADAGLSGLSLQVCVKMEEIQPT